jgi:hypothetical protein
MRLEWILLLVALMAFSYNFVHQQPITLSFDVKNPLSPEEPTFTAQATTSLGPLKLSYSTSWGRSLSSKLAFDMELKPKESWVEVQFTTDSLKGILVRQRGDKFEEGDLLGFTPWRSRSSFANWRPTSLRSRTLSSRPNSRPRSRSSGRRTRSTPWSPAGSRPSGSSRSRTS